MLKLFSVGTYTPPATHPVHALQNDTTATPPPPPPISTKQTLPRSSLKHIINALASQTRALQILLSLNSSPHLLPLFRDKEALAAFAHFLLRYRVVSQILLEPDEDDGHAGAAV